MKMYFCIDASAESSANTYFVCWPIMPSCVFYDLYVFKIKPVQSAVTKNKLVYCFVRNALYSNFGFVAFVFGA